MIRQPLEPTGAQEFTVPKKHDNLVGITNLHPNGMYTLLFNDFQMSFSADKSGTLYMNKDKGLLPVGCLPYNVISIYATPYTNTPELNATIANNPNTPIGIFTDTPTYKWPCEPIPVYCDLTARDAEDTSTGQICGQGGILGSTRTISDSTSRTLYGQATRCSFFYWCVVRICSNS